MRSQAVSLLFFRKIFSYFVLCKTGCRDNRENTKNVKPLWWSPNAFANPAVNNYRQPLKITPKRLFTNKLTF
ncbi:hypothetical protein, partial [uncultured Fibrobacter sp.]|uniref:hypothetical protein n=1 Tax=uncultured Fibrobacter sp. TaxID=261512 RepID=UPI0025FBB520